MASAVVEAIFGSYDLHIAKVWRDEDIAHRDQEIQWLNDDIVRAHQWRMEDIERLLRKEKLENEFRSAEARAEQLSTVSEQCALLVGFTVASMSNLNIPESNVPEPVLILYGTSATLVCVSLLLSMIMCTMLLVAVTRFGSHSLPLEIKKLSLYQLETESVFGHWWLCKCESELNSAYKFLHSGVSLFFVYLGSLSWIQFNFSVSSASGISLLAFAGLCFWQLHAVSKWRYLLTPINESSRFSDSYYVNLLEEHHAQQPRDLRLSLPRHHGSIETPTNADAASRTHYGSISRNHSLSNGSMLAPLTPSSPSHLTPHWNSLVTPRQGPDESSNSSIRTPRR